jgi:ribosomal protein L11 methylase PrmA
MSWFILAPLFIFIIILLTFAFLIVAVAIQGAPFVPTTRKKIEIIKNFACFKPEIKIADLGSGDGRLTIAIAKNKAIVHGYEINPFLILISRLWIKFTGLKNTAHI